MAKSQSEHEHTSTAAAPAAADGLSSFALEVVEGPQKGVWWEGPKLKCSVGSHPSNELVLEDSTVSRFHCEVWVGPEGLKVRDLESKNGTVLDGIVVSEAAPRDASLIRLGNSVLRIQTGRKGARLPLSEKTRLGDMVGASATMRAAFALLEKAAATQSTVLLEGETGTGKDAAARWLHQAGERRNGPFIVVDCGSLQSTLIEGELLGYEKGAFTGATERHAGAFELAAGGTIFLDEIGELPLNLQPKLLRALEHREVRRLGGSAPIAIDVRVIAATNRDLRAEVNGGGFRSDLYYRLAVMRVTLPPLRERLEDVDLLASTIVEALKAEPGLAARLKSAEFIAELKTTTWPGNVRELRNFLERCLVVGQPLPLESVRPKEVSIPVDTGSSFREARRRVLDEFERRYVRALLEAHDGNVSAAARRAGIGRVSLYALLNRHGLK